MKRDSYQEHQRCINAQRCVATTKSSGTFAFYAEWENRKQDKLLLNNGERARKKVIKNGEKLYILLMKEEINIKLHFRLNHMETHTYIKRRKHVNMR